MAKMTEEDEVKATVRDLGVTEAEARFIVAIERGEIDGDEVVVQSGEPLLE
jgi:hypothetical protein